jgi:hypothetical protein
LAELVTDETDTARDTLLADLLQRFETQRAESLRTLAVPGSEYARWLRRHGFFAGPRFSVQLVPLAEGLPLERMRDPMLWNLSGADFDVV